MKIIKSKSYNKIADDLSELFISLDEATILEQFHNLKSRY